MVPCGFILFLVFFFFFLSCIYIYIFFLHGYIRITRFEAELSCLKSIVAVDFQSIFYSKIYQIIFFIF